MKKKRQTFCVDVMYSSLNGLSSKHRVVLCIGRDPLKYFPVVSDNEELSKLVLVLALYGKSETIVMWLEALVRIVDSCPPSLTDDSILSRIFPTFS